VADSSVLLEVIVEGKNIKIVQREVEELGASINNASTNTEKNTKASKKNTEQTKKQSKSAGELDRNIKGVAGATNNGTKAFQKMSQGMGGLVSAYAAIAANVFALTALFGALGRAASLEKLEEGLIATGTAAGQNLPAVAKSLKEISGFAISTKEAMEATAIATSAGFSTTQLEKLTMVARGASQALGRDMSDALSRLVRGTAKLEPEILDELGIMVRLDEASIEYAASLGKTVQQLTRFEKQQAFLNATIEQGTKKFGDIAESIDPNSFDKLAATFDDLAKTMFNWINVVALPVAEFLANNKIALTGALLVFAKTISNQVIPALTEMAASQAALAVSAAANAKKAGTVISNEYVRSLEKIDFSAGKASKSFMAMLPSIKAGTASTSELKTAVRQLSAAQGQLTKEENRLKGNRDAASKARLAEIQQEKQAIIDLKNQVQGLAETERNRVNQSGAGVNLSGISVSNKALSQSMNEMDRATGITNKLKVAIRGSSRQFRIFGATVNRAKKSTKGFSLGLIQVRAGFRAASASAKLFGAALLQALPVIGQLIFVAGLLYDAFSWLWEDSAVEKAADNLTENFEKMAATGAKLREIELDPNQLASDVANAKISAQIGLLDQLEAGINSLRDARAKDLSDDISGNVERIGELESFIEKKTKMHKLAGRTEEEIAQRMMFSQRELDRQRQIVARAQQEYATIDKETFGQTVEQFLAQIQVEERLAAAFGDRLDALKEINRQVQEGEITNYGEAATQVSEIIDPIKNAKAASDGLGSAFNEVTKASIKLTEGAKTKYDPLISAVQDVSNSLVVLRDRGEEGLSLITEDEKKRAEGLVAAYRDLNLEFSSGGTYIDQLESAVNALREQNNLIVTSAAKQKNFNAQAKFYSELAKESVGFTSLQIEASRQASDAAIAGKEAERVLTAAAAAEAIAAQKAVLAETNAENATREEREQLLARQQEAERTVLQLQASEAAIKQEIVALELARIDPAKEAFMLEEARINAAQRLLDIQNRLQRSAEAINEINAKNARAQLEASRAQTGSAVTPQDEYNLTVAANNAKLAVEDERLRLTKEGIRLEYDLLEAKAEFERARLQGIASDTESRTEKERKAAQDQIEALGRITSLLGQSRTAAIAVADAQSESNRIAINTANTIAREKMLREDVRLTLEKTRQTLELINSISQTGLGNALQLGVLAEERATLERELSVLIADREAGAENQQAIAQKQLELQKKVGDQLQIQLGLMEELSTINSSFQLKVTSALKEQVSMQREIADLRNTDPITGNPRDIIKAAEIAEQERQDRLKIAAIESQIKKDMIDAEYSLLEAKYALLEAELKKDGLTSEENAVLQSTRTVLNQTAMLNDIKKQNIDTELSLLEEQIKFQREKETYEAIQQSAQTQAGGGLLAAVAAISARESEGNQTITKKIEEMFGEGTTVDETSIMKATLDELMNLPDITVTQGQTTQIVSAIEASTTAIVSAITAMNTSEATPTATEYTAPNGRPMEETAAVIDPLAPLPIAQDERIQNIGREASAASLNTALEETKPTIDPTDLAIEPPSLPEPPAPSTEGIQTFGEAMSAARTLTQGFAADLAQLGPEGAAMSQFIQGGLNLTDSISSTITNFEEAEGAAGKAAAVLGGISSAIGAIGQMMKAQSDMAVAAVDKEIAAEKKKDGKSKESIAKIKQLEAKKEAIKKKAFEKDKKMKMAQTIASTATAIMQTLAQGGPFMIPIAVMIGAMGAAQLAVIAGTSYEGGGGSGATPSAPSEVSIGKRQSTVDLAKSQSSAGEVSYLRGAQGMGGPENFTPAFMGAKYRAMGGQTGYVVGEQGPELFMPDRPGTIVPADDTENLASAPTNVNFTINAVDAAGVDEVITRQRGTIIGVIREAANSYGNEFLESVDTGVYTPSSTGTRVYQGTK